MVPRAEVTGDDQFVFEPICPLDKIVQVHVAELVDFLPPVLRAVEGQFGNQDAGLKCGFAIVEAFRRRVTRVANQRKPHLGRHFFTRKFAVSDFVLRKVLQFRFELAAPIPHNVPDRRHGVSRFKNGHDVLAGQFEFVAGLDTNHVNIHSTAIQPLPGVEHDACRMSDLIRQINRRRLHLHHPPPCDECRQSRHVVQVAVRNEESGRTRKRPRTGTEVEAEFQFRDPPVALHCRSRVALDCQSFELARFEWQILNHDSSSVNSCCLSLVA